MIKPFLAIGLLLGVLNTTTAVLPQVIKIGSDTSYAPYEWLDVDGTAKGFEVELTDAMCQHLGVKCVFVATDFDGLIPSLQSEKVDMLVSALAMTEKRQRQIAFSDKIFAVAPRLIAPKGADLQPTADSLRGKNVGVEQGTTQESYANAVWRNQGVNVIAYQNQHLVYEDLVAGRLDASLQDQVAGEEGFLKQEKGKDFAFTGPAINDTKYFGVGTGFGFRKGDDELREAFNQALIAIRADGTYQAIAAKYFDFDIYGG
ncbi:transporter substrate-binding domain-containing protein [Utexia brackfieldae]|uniref:transporter substrate-binding domain-containing protein n=1 Tax=Utexia brackfieldae TaxID=3074108 RepID=UPI00370D9F9A